MKQNAMKLLLNSRRFDFIFKYLYLKNLNKKTDFFEKMYLEHIRAFNNFHEQEPSDNIPKDTPDSFLKSFHKLYDSMSSYGFDSNISVIPVGDNGEISDGAHRLVCAAILGLDVELEKDGRSDCYDYKWFRQQGIKPLYADYAALEYVKLNPNTYIVNLHSVADKTKDSLVENILNKYGFVFYQKDIELSFNGYVNLKKLSYGSFWEQENWIGSVENKYAGAQAHAKCSMGTSPLRAYVFVCDDLKKVIKAKAEIRALFDLGNYSVHINDTREEAIWLAQTYFNDNSLHMLNARSFVWEDERFDILIENLKTIAQEKNIDIYDVCAAGSTPLDIYGARKSDDLDFLYAGDMGFNIQTDDLSNHDSELKYYPGSKSEIVYNPINHFYYHGLKFISLDVLLKMKTKRHEKPKDINDCKTIKKLKKTPFVPFCFQKIKKGKKRTIVLFRVIKFTYHKK